MSLCAPNNEQLQKIYEQMGVTENGLERDIESLQDWQAKQPQLPSPADKRLLRWYLLQSKGSMEETKRMVEAYYTIRRRESPELFRNRDPLRPELLAAARSTALVPLPRLTEDGHRIVVFKMFQPQVAARHAIEYCIMCMMSGEIRILEDINAGNVLLVDLSGFTASHLGVLTLPLVRKYAFYMQNIYKEKVKGIHIVNASTILEKLSILLKQFFKEKVYKRMSVHTKHDKLLEIFPQEVLPEDYGGTLPPLSQLNDMWLEKVISYRDWFKEEETRILDESKQESNANSQLEFGVEGSFRKLTLD